MKPAMDAIFLIADNDVRCRGELRRFLSNSGFLVAAVANGLECLAQLVALEPDVLVIAMEIPWGGGDGVIARLNDGLPIRSRPRVLVIGNAPAEALSARSGVAQCNCFPKPLRMDDLLDRIGRELAASCVGAHRRVVGITARNDNTNVCAGRAQMIALPVGKNMPASSWKPRSYCIHLKISPANREDAWELFRVVLHYGGVEVSGCCFAFVNAEQRLMALESLRFQFGPEYFEAVDMDIVEAGTRAVSPEIPRP